MSLHEQIRNFIQSNLVVFDDDVDFSNEDNIFELGFVNSLFAMKLVTYIESDFNTIIESDEMDINNFNTIDNIVSFIQSKTGIQ